MKIGVWIDDDRPLSQVLAAIEEAATLGFARAWLAQILSWDALTVLAALGERAPGIELGVGVAGVFPKHPVVLAQQARTTAAATGGRFSLGVGPSPQSIVEGIFGYRWERPAQYVREYLDALVPLLRGEPVDVRGERIAATAALSTPDAPMPPLLISALGPVLLRLAGERTDGTITAWAGPCALDEHVVPRITAAAEAAGRPAPQVVACVSVAVTTDVDGVRGWVADRFGPAGELPSYRAMLDRDGRAGPADAVVIGDEHAVERELRRYRDAGVTEFMVAPAGPAAEQERTLAVLGQLARSSAGA